MRFNGACLPMLCLVQLSLTLLVFSQLTSFSFVQSASRDHHRAIEGQVSLRSVGKRQADSGEPEPDSKAEAKQYTVAVKRAPTPKNLIETLDLAMDRPIFDYILASAAYTQLAYFTKRRLLEEADWESQVLVRLHARVEDMVLQKELDAQGSSNILWTLAQLSDGFTVPTQLLAALIQSVPTQVRGMDEQELSNSLWACAKLKDVAPAILQVVPSIAVQIPNKAKDMVPQALSNCLWACLQLEDEASTVRDIVPAIVTEVPSKIKNMKPQALCNSLESLVPLQEAVPEIANFLADDGSGDGIVRSAASHLSTLLPGLKGKDLNIAVPAVVWACARVGVHHDELLASVEERLGLRAQLSRLRDFGLCALSWSYQVLDAEDDFSDFQKLLKSEITKRGLSEVDVESSKLGYLKWNRAKV